MFSAVSEKPQWEVQTKGGSLWLKCVCCRVWGDPLQRRGCVGVTSLFCCSFGGAAPATWSNETGRATSASGLLLSAQFQGTFWPKQVLSGLKTSCFTLRPVAYRHPLLQPGPLSSVCSWGTWERLLVGEHSMRGGWSPGWSPMAFSHRGQRRGHLGARPESGPRRPLLSPSPTGTLQPEVKNMSASTHVSARACFPFNHVSFYNQF